MRLFKQVVWQDDLITGKPVNIKVMKPQEIIYSYNKFTNLNNERVSMLNKLKLSYHNAATRRISLSQCSRLIMSVGLFMKALLC